MLHFVMETFFIETLVILSLNVDELLGLTGSSFALRSSKVYVEEDECVSFFEVALRAQKLGEVLVGYQKREAVEAPTINPKVKVASMLWGEYDFICLVPPSKRTIGEVKHHHDDDGAHSNNEISEDFLTKRNEEKKKCARQSMATFGSKEAMTKEDAVFSSESESSSAQRERPSRRVSSLSQLGSKAVQKRSSIFTIKEKKKAFDTFVEEDEDRGDDNDEVLDLEAQRKKKEVVEERENNILDLFDHLDGMSTVQLKSMLVIAKNIQRETQQ